MVESSFFNMLLEEWKRVILTANYDEPCGYTMVLRKDADFQIVYHWFKSRLEQAFTPKICNFHIPPCRAITG